MFTGRKCLQMASFLRATPSLRQKTSALRYLLVLASLRAGPFPLKTRIHFVARPGVWPEQGVLLLKGVKFYHLCKHQFSIQ